MPRIEIEGTVDIGETFQISLSRRDALKSLATIGVGGVGLKTLVERAVGGSVEGVPLVLTRDERGNPDRVRLVPQERRRRIRVYESLRTSTLMERHPFISEITIEQRSNDETDLCLVFRVAPEGESKIDRLPDQIQDIPVKHRVVDIWERPHCQDPNNGARRCEDHDTLIGGIQISPSSGGFGSLCLVAHDASDGHKKLITARHVMDDSSNGDIHQPAHSGWCSNSQVVGAFETESTAEDIWAADMDELSISGDVGGTVSAIPDITGYWTYTGITDQTTSGSIYCHMAGAESQKREGYAVDTSQGSLMDHQVDYGDMNGEHGDSGAPYVDPDGKLVSMYNGCQGTSTDSWDIGTAGDYVLEPMNASLFWSP